MGLEDSFVAVGINRGMRLGRNETCLVSLGQEVQALPSGPGQGLPFRKARRTADSKQGSI